MITKIGISIVHCATIQMSAGFRIAYTSDQGTWSNIVDDTRDVFNYLVPSPTPGILRMVKFTTQGWYLCSMRPISGRGGEYNGSWIFFPASMELSGAQIQQIVEVVDRSITNVNEEELQQLIAHTAQDTPYTMEFMVPAQKRSKYAVRYVGGTYPTLEYVFGNIYQKVFTEYDWVFLLESTQANVSPNIVNISGEPLLPCNVVEAVDKSGFGFTAYLDKTPFPGKMRLPGGGAIKISWKRDGWVTKPRTGSTTEELSMQPGDAKLVVKPDNFQLYDINGNMIRTAKFGIQVMPAETGSQPGIFKVPVANLGKAVVSFDVDGYEATPVKPVNLEELKLNSRAKIKVVLKPSSNTYKFELPLTTGGSKIIEIERQFALDRSPLAGYEVAGGKAPVKGRLNRLVPVGGIVTGRPNIPGPKPGPGPEKQSFIEKFAILWFALFVAAAGVIIYLSISLWKSGHDQDSQDTDVIEVADGQKTTPTDNQQSGKGYTDEDMEKAINYLEKSEKYNRNDMEKSPVLKGLWDKLNTFDFAGVQAYAKKYPELTKSYKFADLLVAMESRNNSNQGLEKKFCRQENDINMTYDKYLDYIEGNDYQVEVPITRPGYEERERVIRVDPKPKPVPIDPKKDDNSQGGLR